VIVDPGARQSTSEDRALMASGRGCVWSRGFGGVRRRLANPGALQPRGITFSRVPYPNHSPQDEPVHGHLEGERH
jgi:hypothetical protein